MNARNDVKKPFDHSLAARLVLAAARLRFATRVDFLVARWLERCAANAEAAQRLFKTDLKPTRDFGMGVNLVVSSSPRWESPHDGGRRRGGNGIKVEAAHMAASLTLLQITS